MFSMTPQMAAMMAQQVGQAGQQQQMPSTPFGWMMQPPQMNVASRPMGGGMGAASMPAGASAQPGGGGIGSAFDPMKIAMLMKAFGGGGGAGMAAANAAMANPYGSTGNGDTTPLVGGFGLLGGGV